MGKGVIEMFGTRGSSNRTTLASELSKTQSASTPKATRLANTNDPLYSQSSLSMNRSTGGRFIPRPGTLAKERMEMNDEIQGANPGEDDEAQGSEDDYRKDKPDQLTRMPTALPISGTPDTFGHPTPNRSRASIVNSDPSFRRKGRSHSPLRPKGHDGENTPRSLKETAQDLLRQTVGRATARSPTPSEEELYNQSPDHTFYVRPRSGSPSQVKPLILSSTVSLGSGAALNMGGGSASSTALK